MKNACKTIEPLLPLYRDRELSESESTMVAEHLQTCSRCAAIAQEFGTIDAALSAVRSESVQATPPIDLTGATMARISALEATFRPSPSASAVTGRIFVLIQRSLGFALAVLALLFVFQQTKDSVSVTRLEDRLRAQGAAASASETSPSLAAIRKEMSDIAGDENRSEMFRKPAEAAMPPVTLFNLFRHQSNAIEQLAERYPRLQSVRLDDGIDERERQILATDGREFLNDVQQLVSEGARKP